MQIGGERHGKYGNQKVKLALPPKKDIHNFIQSNFTEFVESLKITLKIQLLFIFKMKGIYRCFV
jgi:hypothetical protein